MFFDLILLNQQHNSRFGFAWVAATLGVKHVPKREIQAINIAKLCENIQNYLCSQSLSPKQRFSLRLSSLLLNGTVKLYRQQIIYFQDDLFALFTPISRTREATFEFIETPPTPVQRKRTKKRQKVELSTPDSELFRLIPPLPDIETALAVVPARADEITLREVQLPRQPTEDFGELGTFTGDFLMEIGELQIEPSTKMPTITEVPEEPMQVPKAIESSPSPEIPPTTIIVHAQVHTSADVDPRESRPERFPTPEGPIARAPILEEAHVDTEIRHVPVPVRPVKKKPVERDVRVRKDLDKLLIDHKPQKFLRINACERFEFRWTDISSPPISKSRFKICSTTALINMYMIKEEKDLQEREKSEASGLGDSASLRRKPRQPTLPLQEVPEAPVLQAPTEEHIPKIEVTPAVVEVPLMASMPLPQQVTVDETAAMAAEEMAVSPRKKRRQMYDEPKPKEELAYISMPTRDLTTSAIPVDQRTVESVDLPVATAEERHQKIINKVFALERVTLEQICEKPINRLHIARAFNDCLVLCRYNYVTLINKPESCELAFIEKGPKMFRGE